VKAVDTEERKAIKPFESPLNLHSRSMSSSKSLSRCVLPAIPLFNFSCHSSSNFGTHARCRIFLSYLVLSFGARIESSSQRVPLVCLDYLEPALGFLCREPGWHLLSPTCASALSLLVLISLESLSAGRESSSEHNSMIPLVSAESRVRSLSFSQSHRSWPCF
jgi:hypothetical protein